jgi:hypothetical protein
MVGWIAPAVMLVAAILATALRHRWRLAMWMGALVGGGFCGATWLVLRLALGHSDRAAEIVFLQIALSTAGLFGFSLAAMFARKWQEK